MYGVDVTTARGAQGGGGDGTGGRGLRGRHWLHRFGLVCARFCALMLACVRGHSGITETFLTLGLVYSALMCASAAIYRSVHHG